MKRLIVIASALLFLALTASVTGRGAGRMKATRPRRAIATVDTSESLYSKQESLPETVQKLVNSVRTLNQRTCSGYTYGCINGRCVKHRNRFECVCKHNYHGEHCNIYCPPTAKYSSHERKCVCQYAGHTFSNGKCVNRDAVPNECTHYKTLSTAWRNDQNALDQYSPRGARTDEEMAPGWYRFNGAAGSQMATYCVQEYHCGTYSPLHMTGELPTMDEGAVTRKACSTSALNCCDISITIKVRLCPGYFYVYFLPVMRTQISAYCGSH